MSSRINSAVLLCKRWCFVKAQCQAVCQGGKKIPKSKCCAQKFQLEPVASRETEVCLDCLHLTHLSDVKWLCDYNLMSPVLNVSKVLTLSAGLVFCAGHKSIATVS